MGNRTITINSTQYPLLETKLYVPQPRPNLVQRAELIDRLNEGIHYKLTLISAPAGFGKTTLLSEWISQSHIPVAWISLDKNDNDSIHFINYLVAAFKRVAANIGDAVLSMLRSSQQPPIESIMQILIKEITHIPNGCALVLDDYHSIDTEKVHNIVASLLDYLPRHIRLVIATRIDPPFPLARLRGRNQLIELRAADLCFTVEETTQFFNKVMNIELSNHDISILESRTEGWIAGLQLAALSMQGREDIPAFIKTFAGDDRHIVDYLAEEVLNLQPTQIRNFLLWTSILSRLSESLCDFVTKMQGCQKILNELEKANLFIIPLDNKRYWYRYHHLFADLLQQRLRQTQNEFVPELHKRASIWHEKNNLKEEAVEHSLKARDFERSAHLIGEFAKKAWDYGGNTQMLKWYEQIPQEFIHKDAELTFFNAWMLFENGQYDSADENLKIVEGLIESCTDHTGRKSTKTADSRGLGKNELKGKVAVIRAYIASFKRNIPDIIRFSTIALKCLPDTSLSWRATAAITLGDAHYYSGEMNAATQKYAEAAAIGKKTGNYFVFLGASLGKCKIKRQQGDLPGALKIYKQLLDTSQEKGVSQTPMMGWVFARRGEILIEFNQLNDALQNIQKAIELSKQGDDASMMGQSYFFLAKLLFTKGDIVGAKKEIKKIDKMAVDSDIPHFVAEPLEELKVRIWLKQNRSEAALQWMKDHEFNESESYTPMRESKYILFARIFLSQDRLDESLNILQGPFQAAEKEGRITRVIEMLLIQAQVRKAQGDIFEAVSLLRKALFLAGPGGFISIFVDEGQPVAELLEKILNEKKDVPRPYVKKLLSAFKISELIKTDDEMVERLSDRELEVLRFIAAGLSNKKIMDELFISMSTVKTHIRNIYGKLNVNSRTQAIVKAKELDLL